MRRAIPVKQTSQRTVNAKREIEKQQKVAVKRVGELGSCCRVTDRDSIDPSCVSKR